MIKIPSLPFACSIAGGEQHAGLGPDNEIVFKISYFADLYNWHKADVTLLLTEKLSKELSYYVDEAHRDLAVIMFDRLANMKSHGIICTYNNMNAKKPSLTTIAYHYVKETDCLAVAYSIMYNRGKEKVDCPILSFSVKRNPGSLELHMDIPADVSVPLLVKEHKTLKDLDDMAWYSVKLICAVEALGFYKYIKCKALTFDATAQKNGTIINPNYIKVKVMGLESEDIDVI